MPDAMSPEARSKLMSRIRGRDTRPELYVRRRVWSEGFRYRLHVRSLPGVPDLVLPRYRMTVFVHGCFWHQHGCSRTSRPSSNQSYWEGKLDGNVARDEANRYRLEKLGWTVVVVWECSLDAGVADLLVHLIRLRGQLQSKDGG